MYNIIEYGAVGDGKTNDAAAIQSAIDTCHNKGGGRVFVPAGYVFKTGSIVLKSNVELHLESGAMLKASENMEDYSSVPGVVRAKADPSVPSYINCEYNGKPYHYFIYAKDGEHISITGLGKIDGTEEMYYGTVGQYHIEGIVYPRVPMILVENIKHLTIRDVTLQRSGFWTVHMAGCEDVLIDCIRILNNLKMANADGIDPDHCKNVRILNSHLECADDCIVLKNTNGFSEYGACENILISGCTLISTSSAIKFGTESEADFKNVIIDNCNISRSNRGLCIQLRDCGNVSNIQFSNINIETRRFSKEWWGRAEAIYVTAIDRKEGVKAGHIKNVRFQNINCTGEGGVFIHGSNDNIIEDLSFENVSVTLDKTSKWDVDSFDLRPCQGEGIIKRKISGFYCDYAKNVALKNVNITCNDNMKQYVAQKVELHNVEDIQF